MARRFCSTLTAWTRSRVRSRICCWMPNCARAWSGWVSARGALQLAANRGKDAGGISRGGRATGLAAASRLSHDHSSMNRIIHRNSIHRGGTECAETARRRPGTAYLSFLRAISVFSASPRWAYWLPCC